MFDIDCIDTVILTQPTAAQPISIKDQNYHAYYKYHLHTVHSYLYILLHFIMSYLFVLCRSVILLHMLPHKTVKKSIS